MSRARAGWVPKGPLPCGVVLAGLPQTFCTSSVTRPRVSSEVPVPRGRTQTPTHPTRHHCGWAGMGDARGRGEAGFRRVRGELVLAPAGHPTEERCPQGRASSPRVPAGLGQLHPTGAGGHYGVAAGQDLAPGNRTQSQARGIGPPSLSEACDLPGTHPLLHRCSPHICAAGQTMGLPAVRGSANLLQTFKSTEQFVLRLY